MGAQLCEYKNHEVTPFKWVNYIVCESNAKYTVTKILRKEDSPQREENKRLSQSRPYLRKW